MRKLTRSEQALAGRIEEASKAKKKYARLKTFKPVDSEIHRATRAALDCNHLTPQVEAAIDQRLGFPKERITAFLHQTCKPIETTGDDWGSPTAGDIRAIEAGDEKRGEFKDVAEVEAVEADAA